MSYDYLLDETRLFHDYNMEAQGDMLADYFLVTFRGSQSHMNNVRYRTTPDIASTAGADPGQLPGQPQQQGQPAEDNPMMRVRLPVTLLGLLLQMMASCTSPPARYQPATVQDRSGVPCFGVPDSSETRAHPPRITGVSVMEVGSGGTPI